MRGCVEWKGVVTKDGYGYFRVGGKKGLNIRAHRTAYRLFVGPIPRGKFVCHRCDNPRCIRVSHLFLGTPLDNARDRVEKGRGANTHGERNPFAVLNWKKVDAIRKSKQEGSSTHALGIEYGVTQECIKAIVQGRNWRIR